MPVENMYGSRNPEVTQRLHVELLSQINRYGSVENMIHRPNLWIHVRRVAYLAQFLASLYNQADDVQPLDLGYIFRMGMMHDDAELITGDISAAVKARMGVEDIQSLKNSEEAAISAIATGIYGFDMHEDTMDYLMYLSIQHDIRTKEDPHAQIVDIADKWDSMGEKIHEVRCGNNEFAKRIILTQEIFKKLERHSSFQAIAEHPFLRFREIPSPDELLEMPKLDMNEMLDTHSVLEVMTDDMPMEWPIAYRTWAAQSVDIFDVRPEKYVFPGWYIDLWTKWNYYPSTTASGLIIPR